MKWAYPLLLWLLPIVLSIAVYEFFQKKKLLEQYQKQSTRSFVLTYLKEGLFFSGLAFLVLALAGPHYGKISDTQKTFGLEVIFALDVSDSMRAQDIGPSRLQKSISEVTKILNKLPNDQAGLVTFEGSATAVCPLTRDFDALGYFLQGATEYREEKPGTNLPAALDEALKMFDLKSDNAKVLIYFTDGENHEGNLSSLKAKALKNHILIVPVGVGQTGGATIPTTGGVLTDKSGMPVKTRLELSALKNIASQKVFVINQSYQSVAEAIVNEMQSFKRAPLDTASLNQYQKQYWIFTLIALLCFVLSFSLPAVKSKFLSVSLMAFIFIINFSALNAWENPKAVFNRAFQVEKTNDISAATALYQKLLASRLSKWMETRALFNLGNTYAKQNKIPEAERAYIEALKIDPRFEPARKNLESLLKTRKKRRDAMPQSGEPKQGKDKNQKSDAERALDNFKNSEQQNIIKYMQAQPRKQNVEKNW